MDEVLNYISNVIMKALKSSLKKIVELTATP